MVPRLEPRRCVSHATMTFVACAWVRGNRRRVPRYRAVSPQRAQRVTLSNARGGPPNQDAPPCFALVIDLIDLEGDPSSVCERSQRPVPGGAEDDYPVPVPVCHRRIFGPSAAFHATRPLLF